MSAYLLRLICAALACGVIRAMAGEGFQRLICGVFLALTVLSLPRDLTLPEFDLDTIAREADSVVQYGREQAQSDGERIIIEALESYIWNEAAALDLLLTVRVELAEDLTPEAVELTGTAGPEQRQRLTQLLVRELGVREEDVIWTQSHQSSE